MKKRQCVLKASVGNVFFNSASRVFRKQSALRSKVLSSDLTGNGHFEPRHLHIFKAQLSLMAKQHQHYAYRHE